MHSVSRPGFMLHGCSGNSGGTRGAHDIQDKERKQQMDICAESSWRVICWVLRWSFKKKSPRALPCLWILFPSKVGLVLGIQIHISLSSVILVILLGSLALARSVNLAAWADYCGSERDVISTLPMEFQEFSCTCSCLLMSNPSCLRRT